MTKYDEQRAAVATTTNTKMMIECVSMYVWMVTRFSSKRRARSRQEEEEEEAKRKKASSKSKKKEEEDKEKDELNTL